MLVLLLALVGGAFATPAAALGAATTPSAPREQGVEEDGPLTLTIDTLTPDTLVVADDASVTLRGTVENVSADEWSEIRVYPVVSAAPITSATELTEAAASADDTFIGNRITTEGLFDASITRLAPGQTQRFTITLPVAELPISGEPGVYWVGVHALGATPEGRTSNAAGRARTFLPVLAPDSGTRPAPTSVVVPLRAPVTYAADGSVADPDRWAETFGPEGRLRELSDLAASPGAASVSWLIDPALLDVAHQLAEGNPGRDLAPSEPASDDETDEPEPDPEATATPEVADDELAETAAAWLSDTVAALAQADTYVLPYGDIDLEGVAATDADLYGVARALARDAAARYGLDTRPALAPPTEGISAAALELLEAGETALVPDVHLPGGALANGASFASVGEVVVAATDTTAASGGPGPGEVTSALQIRQRIAAEAVIDDLVATPDASRTVVLPAAWDPAGGGLPVDGLSAAALDPRPLSATEPSTPPALALDEVSAAAPTEVTPQLTVRDARTLLRDGQRLDRVLPDTDQVAGQIAREAVVGLSYAHRADSGSAADAARAGSAAIDDLLGRIMLEVPQGITLTSETGKFDARIINGLDQPIEVVLEGSAPDGVTISTSDAVTLPAGGSTTVLLDTQIEVLGVHEVELRITDTSGNPVGQPAQVPIRSAAVSDVIWLVIGGGFVVLVLASSLWLRRRRREAEVADEAAAAAAAAESDLAGGTRS